MNNYIIVIVIIIIIFLFSGDKNFINKFMDNKMIILLLIIYFLYNNFNLIILFSILMSVLLYDEKIRKIIYLRYEKNINIAKNRIKNFLDIDKNKQIDFQESNSVRETPINSINDNVNDNINDDVNDNKDDINTDNETIEELPEEMLNNVSDNDELQKLLDEINI